MHCDQLYKNTQSEVILRFLLSPMVHSRFTVCGWRFGEHPMSPVTEAAGDALGGSGFLVSLHGRPRRSNLNTGI